MDIFTLDGNYNRTSLVENFESFIWTERYNSLGDFELVVPHTRHNQSDFRPGRYLELDRSDRLMIIKSVEKFRNSEDLDGIKVSGKSFESIFEERATVMNIDGSPFTREASPEWIINQLVREICVNGNGISSSDIIPNLVISSPDSSTTGPIEVEIPVEPLYKSVKELAESDDFGFRITFDHDTKDLKFKAFKGTDRSRAAISHPMVFSPEYDNLHSTSYLRSIEDYKTSAYVVHADRNRVRVVHRIGYSSGSGMDRRVLIVDANDIENASAAMLDQRGREALTGHWYTSLYDGEVRLTNNMEYGRDYYMGDIVELHSEDGMETRARVVEYIWTYDHAGLRGYPTFSRIEDF